MTAYLAVALAALFAAGLTMYSGFGLGTLLLPVFALFYPVEVAVVATAVVHGANNVFKVSLLGRHADWEVWLRFGVPAIVFAVAGAWSLGALAGLRTLVGWEFGELAGTTTPLKLLMGGLIFAFALFELLPRLRHLRFERRYLPLGGVMISDRVADVLIDKGGEFFHGYTYSGHPAACAVAMENLRILQEEKLVERVKNDIGPYLLQGWKKLEEHPLVGEARMVGLIGALAACSRDSGCDSSEDRRPNVVVVVLDTLRPDHLGAYGYDRETSPHLDAVAEGAFVFENAQTTAPWTARPPSTSRTRSGPSTTCSWAARLLRIPSRRRASTT